MLRWRFGRNGQAGSRTGIGNEGLFGGMDGMGFFTELWHLQNLQMLEDGTLDGGKSTEIDGKIDGNRLKNRPKSTEKSTEIDGNRWENRRKLMGN
jgi:hypothetical protein